MRMLAVYEMYNGVRLVLVGPILYKYVGDDDGDLTK